MGIEYKLVCMRCRVSTPYLGKYWELRNEKDLIVNFLRHHSDDNECTVKLVREDSPYAKFPIDEDVVKAAKEEKKEDEDYYTRRLKELEKLIDTQLAENKKILEQMEGTVPIKLERLYEVCRYYDIPTAIFFGNAPFPEKTINEHLRKCCDKYNKVMEAFEDEFDEEEQE